MIAKKPSSSVTSRCLPGFEHINRYWDKSRQITAAKILPGEYYVTQQEELITTVLGSCISACIRDPMNQIGGMNHFMLPAATGVSSVNDHLAAERYGNYAMEHMINDILTYGGKRDNLEVKVFGGGKILASMTDIGQRNIEFVKQYLKLEYLSIVAEDLGDHCPRKVVYFPLTGQVFLKHLRALHNVTIIERERSYMDDLAKQPESGGIELF